MIIWSLKALTLLIGSKCVPNGTHTNHCCDNLAHASKVIKNSAMNMYMYNLYSHVYVYLHNYIYTHMYMFISYIQYVCNYIIIHVYRHIYVHVCMCVRVNTCTCRYLCMLIYMWILFRLSVKSEKSQILSPVLFLYQQHHLLHTNSSH